MELVQGKNIINDLEEQTFLSINLLEVAKTYCDFNYDKSDEITALGSIINIVLKNQKDVARKIDKFLIE